MGLTADFFVNVATGGAAVVVVEATLDAVDGAADFDDEQPAAAITATNRTLALRFTEPESARSPAATRGRRTNLSLADESCVCASFVGQGRATGRIGPMPVSRTAQGVARARGMMTRPTPAAGDAAGEERLNADLAAELSARPPDDRSAADAGAMFAYLTARTRFFDDLVVGAADRGIMQVVIVGAGYDGRALRFRSPALTFFELDRAATQDDKRARLSRLGVPCDDVRFVPIDLAEGDVDASLAEAGHDRERPSLFVCEGLLLYLDEPVIARLFEALRARSTRESILALSLGVHEHNVSPSAAMRGARFRRRLEQIGEPPRTRLGLEEWDALLGRTGWSIDHAVDPRERAADHPAGGSRLVTAGVSARPR
jgi:methyltransferase (TIGR00027 family)